MRTQIPRGYSWKKYLFLKPTTSAPGYLAWGQTQSPAICLSLQRIQRAAAVAHYSRSPDDESPPKPVPYLQDHARRTNRVRDSPNQSLVWDSSSPATVATNFRLYRSSPADSFVPPQQGQYQTKPHTNPLNLPRD